MTAPDVLAMHVSLTLQRHEDGCTAWVESKGSRCYREPSTGFLCARHHGVAVKRHEKQVAKDAQAAERAAAKRADQLPEWRAELDRLNAEMARMWGIPETTDMAAYGGQMHASIARKANAALSDHLVAKGAKLARRAEQLRALIGDDL